MYIHVHGKSQNYAHSIKIDILLYFVSILSWVMYKFIKHEHLHHQWATAFVRQPLIFPILRAVKLHFCILTTEKEWIFTNPSQNYGGCFKWLYPQHSRKRWLPGNKQLADDKDKQICRIQNFLHVMSFMQRVEVPSPLTCTYYYFSTRNNYNYVCAQCTCTQCEVEKYTPAFKS